MLALGVRRGTLFVLPMGASIPLTMNRRVFVTGLEVVFAAPLGAEAQRGTTQRPGGRLPRVGFLGAGPSFDGFGTQHLTEAFRAGLSESGYLEGQSVTIEFKFAELQYERLAGVTITRACLHPVQILASPIQKRRSVRRSGGRMIVRL
jgi:hypothetical protein